VASHKSALKRIQQTRKRTERNRMHLTKLRHQIRKLRTALNNKNKATVETLLKPTIALFVLSVHIGIVLANSGARY
jgi:small subunit ribosomal protein S20